MPITQSFTAHKEESKSFDPLPKGLYQLEIIDVELVSKLKYQSQDEYENVFQFTFGVVNDGDYRARRHWENFVPTSLYIGKNGKNKLYQIIESAQRAEISPQQEAEGLNETFINGLIGSQMQVAIGKKVKGESVYQIVESWLPAMNQMTPLTEEEKKIEKKSAEPQTAKNTPSEKSNVEKLASIPLPNNGVDIGKF